MVIFSFYGTALVKHMAVAYEEVRNYMISACSEECAWSVCHIVWAFEYAQHKINENVECTSLLISTLDLNARFTKKLLRWICCENKLFLKPLLSSFELCYSIGIHVTLTWRLRSNIWNDVSLYFLPRCFFKHQMYGLFAA